MTIKKVPAPEGIGAAGKKLWTDITAKWALRPDELRVLQDAAFEADLIETLNSSTSGEGFELVVKGSQGQPVINPLISELRQHRSTLAGLLRQLKLPDENAPAAGSQQREAANARWSKRGA
jgi:hypothetical protein